MRVVITGATGNVGTALVRLLAGDPRVRAIDGVARRRPEGGPEGVTWHALDVERDDLEPVMRDAGAVVHLAWRIQPSRDLRALWRTNVVGGERVFGAAARAGVPALVHASSVGVYSPGPKDRAVDESWPRLGTPTSFYARHKAACERLLDRLERDAPGMRVVRMRPALIFAARAAQGVRRLFAGPFLPSPLVRPGRIPVVPDIAGLRFQAAHSDDVAEAYRLAIAGDARGAFNVAADPVLDPGVLSEALGARRVRVGPRAARATVAATHALRLHPTPPGWLDMALSVPVMDSGRARRELGWEPRRTSVEALRELLAGMAEGAGADTPPLSPRTGGPARLRELAGRIGGREGR